jgi:flagellar motor switch protein FliG
MTGARKVAVFLMSLQNKALVSQIMNAFNKDELNAILAAMSETGIKYKIEKIILNFIHDFKGLITMATGPTYATEFVKQAFQNHPEKLTEALDKIQDLNTSDIWNAMSNLDDNHVLKFIKNEHPQTVAIILSKISSVKAAKILNLLQDEYAQEVISRMLSLQQIKQQTLQSIEQVLQEQIHNPNSMFYTSDNINKLADIFNHFNEDEEDKFMSFLKKYNEDSANKIARLKFTFNELDKLDNISILELIKNLDNKILVKSLKHAEDKIKQLFINSLSSRASRILMDELDSGLTISVKESLEAQRNIMKKVHLMLQDGSLTLKKINNSTNENT